MEKIKQILLSIVYFIVIVFIMNKLLNLLPWTYLRDVFTLWCWGVAVIVSTGLAQYTLRKVRES